MKKCSAQRRKRKTPCDEEFKPTFWLKVKVGKIPCYSSIVSSQTKIIDLSNCLERSLDLPNCSFTRNEYLFSERVKIHGQREWYWRTTLDVPECSFVVNISSVEFTFEVEDSVRCPDGYWVYRTKKLAEDAVMLKAIFLLRPDFLDYWLAGYEIVQLWKNGNGGKRYFKTSNHAIDGWFVLFKRNQSYFGIGSSSIIFEKEGRPSASCLDHVYQVL